MGKGLEISFQLNNDSEGEKTVLALANLTGNKMRSVADIQWRIFHVTLGENKFYKVLFSGPKVSRLHLEFEKRIREFFDSTSHMDYRDLMELYARESKADAFRKEKLTELEEEYDLWQDKFWQYF